MKETKVKLIKEPNILFHGGFVFFFNSCEYTAQVVHFHNFS